MLGPRITSGSLRGHNTEIQLSDEGPGGARAQAINAAAAGGFATAAYQRVFGEYQVAVEESLQTNDVPAGKRYLVRRYFQLIRPRIVP